MIVIGIDPSMACTGVAIVKRDVGDRILGAWTTRGKGEGWARVIDLRAQILKIIEEAEITPTHAIVETPFATTRGGPKVNHSIMTLPAYGGAVAAAIIACADAGLDPTLAPSDEWSRGLPATWKDKHKEGRVRLAAHVFNVAPERFGTKSNAGNVADAALLARWLLDRHKYQEGVA